MSHNTPHPFDDGVANGAVFGRHRSRYLVVAKDQVDILRLSTQPPHMRSKIEYFALLDRLDAGGYRIADALVAADQRLPDHLSDDRAQGGILGGGEGRAHAASACGRYVAMNRRTFASVSGQTRRPSRNWRTK